MLSSSQPSDGRVDPVAGPAVDVLVLCTGNAARSVMAGHMLRQLGRGDRVTLRVRTAGTHAVDGLPPSWRTRSALAAVPAVADAPVGRHLSRQLVGTDVVAADLVVAMEADHVRYVRRHHPAAADRTATLRWLCRELPPGPRPLEERLRALRLAETVLDGSDDVADPAGCDDDVYRSCALQLWALCQELVRRI